MLEQSRPASPTNLAALSAFLEDKEPLAAMPSELPEEFLVSLAQDLRSAELANYSNSKDGPTFAAPIYAVMKLVLGKSSTEATMTLPRLAECLQAYQWALEREIVSRIVGIPAKDGQHLHSVLRGAARSR
jgi:hypothetical protein